MVRFVEKPVLHIWVNAKPRSKQSASAKSLSRYRKKISTEAAKVVSSPIRSKRIEVGILFRRSEGLPDVDNIIKPILDALKGVVYEDDSQVRAVRVIALPTRDYVASHEGDVSGDDLIKMSKKLSFEGNNFLISIREGIATSLYGLFDSPNNLPESLG